MSEQLTRDIKIYSVFCLREAALDCHHTGNIAPMNVALDVGCGLGVTRHNLEAVLSMTVREALDFDQLTGDEQRSNDAKHCIASMPDFVREWISNLDTRRAIQLRKWFDEHESAADEVVKVSMSCTRLPPQG